MKVQSQSMDRISALPPETIEKILTHMPIRDALRTSILSRKWRYSWTGMPKLVIDDSQFVLSHDQDIDKYKFANAIFHVLLLHNAPILELCIYVQKIDIINDEIDQIILHLSRSNNRKKLIFKNWGGDSNFLPCSFFSLQGLEHLDLSYCAFELSLMNKGFGMLKSLRLDECLINDKKVFEFLTLCPALEEFTWIDTCWEIKLNENELVELFKCLPSVQVLDLAKFSIKPLAAGGMPHKLPISLVHLRVLVLYVSPLELSNLLCVISSSPKLEKIKLEMCYDEYGRSYKQPFKKLPTLQDYPALNLDHLKELEITNFCNSALEMEFVKLIMAKSPVLEKARIELDTSVSVDEVDKMLQDLLQMTFPRASPTANLIITRQYEGIIMIVSLV